jgi:4-hydroxyphenylpyruvate dioxygenase
MAGNGFAPLTISPNYYDDVEARFGLAPDFVAALRQYQILYDEDDRGSYLQLYSPLIGGAFFFEIVQRHLYQGYGAPNAIFRIAAQHQFIRRGDLPSR